MREKHLYQVISFGTTTEAMAMEKYCGQHGLPGRMIPVPREISAGCGLAWRVSAEEFQKWRDNIEETDIKYEKITELLM